MLSNELSEAYLARDEMEASFLAQLLELEGISAQVTNTSLQNAVGDLPYLAVAPRILVKTEELERARQLIHDHFRTRSSDGSPQTDWICPACDESNGPAFEICWKCRRPREAA
jgi:hypothetical protein